MFDGGIKGSNNDSKVLANSSVDERFERGTFNLTEPKPIHGCKFSSHPYYLLGEEMFPLKSWLL